LSRLAEIFDGIKKENEAVYLLPQRSWPKNEKEWSSNRWGAAVARACPLKNRRIWTGHHPGMEGVRQRRIAVVGSGADIEEIARALIDLGVDVLRWVDNRTEENYSKAMRAEGVVGIVVSKDISHPSVKAAINLGKAAFVPDPEVYRLEELAKIEREFNRSEALLVANYSEQFSPGTLKIAELIATGILGEVNYVYCDQTARVSAETIAAICAILQQNLIEITCTGDDPLDGVGTPTIVGLHFSSGKKGHIFSNPLDPFKQERLVVCGDKKGLLLLSKENREELFVYHRPIQLENGRILMQGDDPEPIELEVGDRLRNQCRSFLDALAAWELSQTRIIGSLDLIKATISCEISRQNSGKPVALVGN
jgi:predicted dehydrogenase